MRQFGASLLERPSTARIDHGPCTQAPRSTIRSWASLIPLNRRMSSNADMAASSRCIAAHTRDMPAKRSTSAVVMVTLEWYVDPCDIAAILSLGPGGDPGRE